MVTVAVPAIRDRTASEAPAREPDEALLDRLASVAADAERYVELDGLLRSVTRGLLAAIDTARHENVEPYDRCVAYAARQLAVRVDEGQASLNRDPRYLLGRLDALLDVCTMGIDRTVSATVVQKARTQPFALKILTHLVLHGETRLGPLAEAVGTSTSNLCNKLKWMDAADLVRRTAVGRETLVGLGLKGEAVYLAIGSERAGEDEQSDEPTDSFTPLTALQELRGAQLGSVSTWPMRRQVDLAFAFAKMGLDARTIAQASRLDEQMAEAIIRIEARNAATSSDERKLAQSRIMPRNAEESHLDPTLIAMAAD